MQYESRPTLWALFSFLPSQTAIQPMQREYQNGEGFGYILYFRQAGTHIWKTAKVPHAESLHYVYRNESVEPFTPFEVKIKAFNKKGEGPESLVSIVHSAEEGKKSHKKCLMLECFWGSVEFLLLFPRRALKEANLYHCLEMFPASFFGRSTVWLLILAL